MTKPTRLLSLGKFESGFRFFSERRSQMSHGLAYLVLSLLSLSATSCTTRVEPERETRARTERQLIQIAQYKGDGFSLTHPLNWQEDVTPGMVTLRTPEGISFSIIATGQKDLSTVISNIRQSVAAGSLGFPATFNSTTEPTVYGSWRGDTIWGRGNANGVETVLLATAIEANNQYYLFLMLAPAARSWEANQYRITLA